MRGRLCRFGLCALAFGSLLLWIGLIRRAVDCWLLLVLKCREKERLTCTSKMSAPASARAMAID